MLFSRLSGKSFCIQATLPLACSRPSVSGSVRREAGERGKNEEGLGREAPLAPALSPRLACFSARRCFRSLPAIESVEQATLPSIPPDNLAGRVQLVWLIYFSKLQLIYASALQFQKYAEHVFLYR